MIIFSNAEAPNTPQRCEGGFWLWGTWAKTVSMALCLISTPGNSEYTDLIHQPKVQSYPWNKQSSQIGGIIEKARTPQKIQDSEKYCKKIYHNPVYFPCLKGKSSRQATKGKSSSKAYQYVIMENLKLHYGLVLGLVALIDAKGIDLAQTICWWGCLE